MRKQILALSAGVLLSTMLAGCMENQGDLGNKNIRSNSIRYDANGNLLMDKRFADDQMNEKNRVNGRRLNSNNVIGSHKNYRMEMSGQIAEAITKLDPVHSSYVMLTDHNAYVAVSLDENGLEGDSKLMSRTNTGYMGEEGVELKRKMSSLSTGHHMLTDQIKNEIANEVKRLRPNVEHVYVSANPDFVGRMNAYMNDVKLGHPIQGFIAEFNAMAERIFPAKSGDNKAKSTSIKDKRMIYD
ncbi:YhcN/YlaJ family sporulation lipoprotein [Paenibacillus alkaliterrae]|uniref:YhcN/YlaJ family sporulation lipoprotein n=1 Tax=Paenibacillus alkaliterrae TaxID=320909 RepID=UPI001F23A6FB|nr:YhcN/YlaJ family sporulation lipoprotein [Paenibacillus alkaliterrae]MCF2938564.1 YhcN/YlaJ family sporulation lipoprotein [Paenibacillus alkaliterrae]